VPQNIKVDNDVEYSNIDGLSLKADVYYPLIRQKISGIAMVHGGGWISEVRKMKNSWRWNWLQKAMW
jgi:pectinesterase